MKSTVSDIVSKIFLFEGLSETDISVYMEKCNILQFSSGDVIHSSKYPACGIGVVISGRARIISGNGDALLRILKCGDVFGAASVFVLDEGNRTEVIASGKCKILLIPESVIRDIITSDSNASIRYISFLSDRINFLNSRISMLTAGDTVSKVADFILSLDSDAFGKVVIGDTLTNVASRLNMGRASLYRTIDKFACDGLISRDKDSLIILDRDGLEDIMFKKYSGDYRQRKV